MKRLILAIIMPILITTGFCIPVAAQTRPHRFTKQEQQAISQMKVSPNEKVLIPNAEAMLKPAAKPCENFAWAAVMEAVTAAATNEVQFKQEDLVVRSSAGDRCFSSLTDYEALDRFVAGEYPLGVGRRLRVTTKFQPGPPQSADAYIVALKAGKPALLVWKNHPYLLVGMVYDRYTQLSGDQVFVIREFQMLDPSKPIDSRERKVSFVKGRDDASDIQGIMLLTVETY